MDLSSDPLHSPPGSSPPNIESIDLGELPNSSPSPIPHLQPQAAAPTVAFGVDLSSDPLGGFTPFSADLAASGALRHLSRTPNRKRPCTSHDDHVQHLEPHDPAQQPTTAREAILLARDLVVKAYSLTQSREEQAKLLDLLEVFREYTERGRIQAASSILATQVANLEVASQKIETKARALAKSTPELIRPSQPSQPSRPTFASIASKATPPTPHLTSPQEWTQVGKPKPTKHTNKPTRPLASNRLILVKSPTGNSPTFSPLAIRNAFNKAFLDKGVKGPVVASVTRSLSQKNLVVTTTSSFTADFLLEKQAIWQHIVAFQVAQKDEPWHKVALHGVPTADFNTPAGMALVKEEISTFNKGLNPIGTPYWLTSAEKRLGQRAGSVAVAFATREEANRAIRNRLYIAGISVRVEQLYSTAPTTQCSKCQGFGHLDTHCKKTPTCKLCGEKHATIQHACSTCSTKGTRCQHLVPKCTNCKESHTADYKGCEVLLAIKKKATTTTI